MPTRKSPIRGEKGSEPSDVKASVVRFRFMRKEHLKGRNEIREVFGKGRRFGCRGAKLFILKNELSHNRICFTFSRGFGNAAARNRARRLSREAFRLVKPRLTGREPANQSPNPAIGAGGYDLILLIYPEVDMKLSGRTGQLEFLFSKAGLLK